MRCQVGAYGGESVKNQVATTQFQTSLRHRHLSKWGIAIHTYFIATTLPGLKFLKFSWTTLELPDSPLCKTSESMRRRCCRTFTSYSFTPLIHFSSCSKLSNRLNLVSGFLKKKISNCYRHKIVQAVMEQGNLLTLPAR